MRGLLYLNGVLLALVCLGLFLLPRSYTSFLIHSSWFRDVAGLFDHDTRSVITSNGYPWRAIGVVHDAWLESSCTGFLVSSSRIVTSAHCVLDEGNRVTGETYYSVVRQTHYGTLDYPANGLRTPLTGLSTDQSTQELSLDIAWFDVSPGIGDELGFLGVDIGGVRRPGRPGSMAGTTGAESPDGCRGTLSSPPWLANPKGPSPKGQGGGPSWLAPDASDLPGVCAAGYSADLGFAKLSVADDCGVLAVFDGLVLHTCFLAGGASGGPLFFLDEQGLPVVFAVNAGEISADDLGDAWGAFDLERIFVGVLLHPQIEGGRQRP